MPERTLDDIAAEINALFWDYGLTHEVVSVDTMGLDDRLVFLNADSAGAMGLLLESLTEVFRGYFEAHPPGNQTKLF